MRRRKVMLGAVLPALVAGLAIFGMLPRGPALAWKVVDIQPSGPYWVRDGMEPRCWRVEIEVTNLTSSEVIVDWNRDKTAFQVAGEWEDLGLAAMMPYLGPNASRTFSLTIPQRARACRIQMYYENGPIWSRVDKYLKNHGIYAPDKLFIPVMKLNKKMPGHFRRLDIEVTIPPNISGVAEIREVHNSCVQATKAAWWFRWAVQMKATSANLAHALDGGIPFLLHIGRHLPAASDEQCWVIRVL